MYADVCNLTGHTVTFYDSGGGKHTYYACGKVSIREKVVSTSGELITSSLEDKVILDLEIDNAIPKNAIVIVSNYFTPRERAKLLYDYLLNKGYAPTHIVVPDIEREVVRDKSRKVVGVRGFLNVYPLGG